MNIFSRVLTACVLIVLATTLTDCGSSKQQFETDDNTVVVYNCNTEDWTAPIAKEFQEETGIRVKLVAGGSGELMARVRTEKEDPRGDVLWGGAADAYAALTPCLEPYDSPEKTAIDPHFVRADNVFYSVTMDPFVLAYNTDLVSETDAPQGWRDLLDPKFRGRIALADPVKTSSTYALLFTMTDVLGDASVIGRLAEHLDGKVAAGSAAQMKAVADGEYAVTATFEAAVMRYIDAGAHVKIVYPKEGTQISSGGIAVLRNAKHMENAKKFLNFVMSKEVHERFAQYDRRSTRADIPAPENLRPLAEISFTRFDTQRAVSFRDEFLSKWRAAIIK